MKRELVPQLPVHLLHSPTKPSSLVTTLTSKLLTISRLRLATPRLRLLRHPRLRIRHVRYLEALLEALLEARAPIALLHQILRRSESPGLLPAFWGVWAARSSAVCSPTSVTFANARRLQADVLPRMRSAMRHGARLRLAPKPTPMLYPSKWSRPLPVPR